MVGEDPNLGICRGCGLKLSLVHHAGMCQECDDAVARFIAIRLVRLTEGRET